MDTVKPNASFTNVPPKQVSRPPAYKPPPPPASTDPVASPSDVPNYQPRPPPKRPPPPPPQETVVRATSPDPRESKLKMVTTEMIETEKRYVQDISFIIDRYLTPLLQSNVLDKDEVRVIFSNIVEIKQVNAQILEGFEKGTDSIATVLLRLIPYLKIYIPYCTNYQKAIQELDRIAESNKKFREYIQDETIINEKGGLQIKDLLIKPIQRITKYPLLINEMLKSTLETDPDFKVLTTLTSQIVEVTQFVNNESSHRDKLQKVIDTSQRLTNTPENWRLVEPSRYYVREGKFKVYRNGKKSKEYVFLFSDIILFTEVNGNSFSFKRYFGIDSEISIPDDQTTELDTQFIIIDQVNDTVYVLQAYEKELRDAFIEDLKKLRQENVKKEARMTEVEEKYKRLNLTGGTGGGSVLTGISTSTLEQLHQMMGGPSEPKNVNRNSHVVTRPRPEKNIPSRKTIGDSPKLEKDFTNGTMTLGRMKKEEKPSIMGFNFRSSNSDGPRDDEKRQRSGTSTLRGTTPTKEVARSRFGTMRAAEKPLVTSDKDLMKELNNKLKTNM